MIKIKHKSSIVIFVLICILLFSVLSLTVTAFIVYNKKQKVLNNNIEVVSFDYIRKWENRYNNESYDLNDFKDLYDWVSAGAFMSVYERYSEFEINSLDDWKMFCLISNVPLMIQGYYYYYNIDPKYYGTDYYLAPHLTGDFAGKTVRLTNDIDFSGVTPTTKQYNSSKDPYALFPMLHIL